MLQELVPFLAKKLPGIVYFLILYVQVLHVQIVDPI